MRKGPFVVIILSLVDEIDYPESRGYNQRDSQNEAAAAGYVRARYE
jgi:hypothetical protein